MRRLQVDLSALHAAVQRMGAEPVEFSLAAPANPILPIEIELERGLELPDLSEVDVSNGLLSYKGRQVLLYIQDHGNRVRAALDDGQKGNKFHLADCKKLKDMRAQGRYERYVVTTRLDGDFYISGVEWPSRNELDGHARLWVCRFCLGFLNYENAKYDDSFYVAKRFSIGQFFAAYSSFFEYLPGRDAGHRGEEGYAKDWPRIAARYKADQDFRCEACGVNLRNQKMLLHVHHRNGVKSDNKPSNLAALCAACHREQADHQHMRVPHAAMQTITRLRREQGLLPDSDWEDALRYCDPALKGVLAACRSEGAPVPEIGLDVQDGGGAVIGVLEIAWPKPRIGIAISTEDQAAGGEAGWSVWPWTEALENIKRLVLEVKGRR